MFRCSSITALVKGVSERVRAEAPSVRLSAAVCCHPDANPDDLGQDWASWGEAGYLDFLCPMNYAGDSDLMFKGLVNAQMGALKCGRTKIRPGLGLSCWRNLCRDARTLASQIMIIREAGLDGFAVFDFDTRAEKVLPVIHSGPTR